MANNIIDSIQLSGVTYGIKGSGGTQTIELTQAQYDALVDKDPNTFYVITDAEAGDLTNYYTKSETNTLLGDKADTATTYTKTEVDTALGGKQDTLVSGTNIKTINNESLLGSGNIDIQGGGGGGKAVSGGTNISITTGETADTINCTLNLENGTNSQSGGLKLKSFVAGNEVRGRDACAFGGSNRANGTNSFVTGYRNTGNTASAFVSGIRNQTTNDNEILFGVVALSNGSHTGDLNGYSDATLLAVGNGNVATQTRHNAFEIRQNGDIYIADTNDTSTTNWYEKPMIKLQDQLGGGGGGTVESAITSGSTNAVEGKAIWSATTFNKDVLLTFNNSQSTNYPEGCTKLKVEVAGSNNSSSINFYSSDEWSSIGSINIINTGSISVINSFNGASYEISGTTVIITYPTVTSVTKINVGGTGNYVYKAVVEGAWVNENTYMSVEVDGKIKALDDKKLDATAYTPTVVDLVLNAASTNPVQNQALYSELRFDNGETETTLTFENGQSTNYPNGCTKLIVEVVGSYNYSYITFYNDNQNLGNITITNYGSIEVTNSFNGASYEISGTTVIITYPTVTNVTKINVNNGDYVYKAIVSSATSLKDQVTANTTALGGKQDTLVSGTNIKTINNQSLLGSGNIDIQGGGGGSSYTAGDGIDITNNVISVTGKVDTSAITTSITSSSTDAQVPSAKAVYDIVGDIETLLSQI